MSIISSIVFFLFIVIFAVFVVIELPLFHGLLCLGLVKVKRHRILYPEVICMNG